jgi:hypothetical protein
MIVLYLQKETLLNRVNSEVDPKQRYLKEGVMEDKDLQTAGTAMHEMSKQMHAAGDRHTREAEVIAETGRLEAQIEAKTVYDVASAMHAAGEQMTVAAMKITDIDQILRLQVRQMRFITEEVKRLREIVEGGDSNGEKSRSRSSTSRNDGSGT